MPYGGPERGTLSEKHLKYLMAVTCADIDCADNVKGFAEERMTLLVTWTHASNVGVRAMDNEHAIMMDVMNELRSGASARRRARTGERTPEQAD